MVVPLWAPVVVVVLLGSALVVVVVPRGAVVVEGGVVVVLLGNVVVVVPGTVGLVDINATVAGTAAYPMSATAAPSACFARSLCMNVHPFLPITTSAAFETSPSSPFLNASLIEEKLMRPSSDLIFININCCHASSHVCACLPQLALLHVFQMACAPSHVRVS